MLRTILIVTLLLSHSAQAAKKPTYGMRPRVYEQVQIIQSYLDEKHYPQAMAAIEELQSASLSPYEKAQLWDIKGITHYQLNELAKAVFNYQQVITHRDDIPEGMYQRSLKTLAQLSMMREDYPAALEYAQQLLAIQADASLHMLIAQAYYRQDDFAHALSSCQKANELQTALQRPPKESWLQLENAIQHGLNNYDAMLDVLDTLLTHYPKPEYLKYMANVYGELNEVAKQTSILETLYEQGELNTSGELLNLASLYQIQNVPVKSGVLLENSLTSGSLETNERSLNLLVSAWSLAKEDDKALKVLEQLAALSQKSEDYLRLAYRYFDQQRWHNSISAISMAMVSEDLKEPGSAIILQGMAQLKIGEFAQASTSFVLAARYEKVKKLASQWLRYSEKEQRKSQELAALGISLPNRRL